VPPRPDHLVEHFQGSHRHAEAAHHLIDLRRRHPLRHQGHRLVQVRHQDAVDHEAGAVADHDRRLADGGGPSGQQGQSMGIGDRRLRHLDQR
jgi:hypothetical protein